VTCRREGLALDVVDELRLDSPVRAVDDEAGPVGRPENLASNAPMSALAGLADDQGH
jgi:hypothetical protein